jgi:allophanate hydrolase
VESNELFLQPRFSDARLALQNRFAQTTAMVAEIFSRIQASGDDDVWTHVLPQAEVMQAQALEARRNEGGNDLPLYGLPFGIKDNIDVAGLPTTAACQNA